jgi:hypothetical protein
VARIADRLVAGGRSAVQALAAWQVARRPVRHARSALLLIMAMAIGLFAASFTSTWKASQLDQADFAAGADIRVSPDRRLGSSIPQVVLTNAHEAIDGVTASMPVARTTGQLTQAAGQIRYVMIDADRAASVVSFREDLGSEPLATTMERLAAERPEGSGIAVDGTPVRIAVDLAIDVESLPEDLVLPPTIPPEALEFAPRLRLVLLDGHGYLHRIELEGIATDGSDVRAVGDLAHPMSDGGRAGPVYPISIAALELRAPAPLVARTATVSISGLVAADAAGTWTPIPADSDPAAWTLDHTDINPSVTDPTIAPMTVEGDLLTLRIRTGSTAGQTVQPVTFGLRPNPAAPPDRYPVIATTDLLDVLGLGIGDEVLLDAVGDRPAQIVAVVDAFPTVDPGPGPVAVLDMPTAQLLRYRTGGPIPQPDEQWLDVEIESATVVDTLMEAPFESRLVNAADEIATALQTDPVALGTIGSLSLGFVAAAVFAGAGFAISAIVSARERLTEFALMRAVGLSRRQLAAWMSLEHGLLIVLSLVFGSAVGLLLSWLVLPLVVLTQDATAAIPEVIVVYPWSTIGSLVAAAIVVLAVVVAVVVTFLRRTGVGSLLRLGED